MTTYVMVIENPDADPDTFVYGDDDVTVIELSTYGTTNYCDEDEVGDAYLSLQHDLDALPEDVPREVRERIQSILHDIRARFTDDEWDEIVPPGWLVSQTYGHTEPPEGYVCVQADADLPDKFDGDIEAAVAYAIRRGGGHILCIGDGAELEPQSDVMVKLEPDVLDVTWIDWREANDRLIYEYGSYGRCDTCGRPCDGNGCRTDRSHEVALFS